MTRANRGQGSAVRRRGVALPANGSWAKFCHEFKTPVTGIRLTLQLLLEEKIGALTPDQRELVAASRDDCERILELVRTLAEFTGPGPRLAADAGVPARRPAANLTPSDPARASGRADSPTRRKRSSAEPDFL
jgi:hypothetical protein